MSRQRLAIAVVLCLALVGLSAWQAQLDQQMQACLDAQGIWDGPRSRCAAARPGPILQSDQLKRI